MIIYRGTLSDVACRQMNILFALPGLHRYNRGAEVAFISLARALSKAGDNVKLIGSGPARADEPYSYSEAFSAPREIFEKFPKMPVLRTEYAYEDLTFVPGLWSAYQPRDYDVTVTCNFPFTNWVLRA